MSNPWRSIALSDYEKHMSLESVMQLQSMNRSMKSQLSEYPADTVMILGIAGGNGLEHIDRNKYCSVYAVDINADYLKAAWERYPELHNCLECLELDLSAETEKLPHAGLLIANLLVEYIGYDTFKKAVLQVKPDHVSCIIQINSGEGEWVSDSPYIHVFDGLESVHRQMDENELTRTMCETGYELIKSSSDALPNGKSLVRLDYRAAAKTAESK